ncbi:LDLR chaperone boca-like [Saccostrea cucullata]|uniref:LDLR chaperone boca-like n=1 Tax=Saccostrea cuccullata TaxID=36930 RepID=UPI002ED568EC
MKTKEGMIMMSCTSHVIVFLCLIVTSFCAKEKEKGTESEKWKKKDIRDYSDADLERLFDQWEENDDEELPEDEQPEWKREPPKVDLSQLDPNNPELMLQASKKGRTLMMFATVSGYLTLVIPNAPHHDIYYTRQYR